MKLRVLFLFLLAWTVARPQAFILPPAPRAPSAVYRGPLGGTTAYYYWIIVRYPFGASGPSSSGTLVNVFAPLDHVSRVELYWASVGDASGYDILRTTSSTPPSGACNCAVAPTTTTGNINDEGAPLLPYTVATGGIGGSVTNFSAEDLAPIFSTSISNPTSTPNLSFTLSSAAPHSFLGNNLGSTAPPNYVTIGPSDLPGSARPGRYLMLHDDSAGWVVYNPDGTVLNTSGSTSQGLQEAITAAWSTHGGYCLDVYGGGVTPTGNYRSLITSSTTIAFPTGWGNCFHAYGVGFQYSGSTANHFFTFDSQDFTETDFHDSQIIYPLGVVSAVFLNPVHDNGEHFAGFTSSIIKLPTIVCTDAGLAPTNAQGIGLEINLPNLTTACGGGSCANGNGVMESMKEISIAEINGCTTGIRVNNPAILTSGFNRNKIHAGDIHGQTTSVQIGTSAVIDGSILGNEWDLTLTPVPAGTGLVTYGGASLIVGCGIGGTQFGGDLFHVSVLNGTNGIVLGSSASSNHITVGTISVSGTEYTNSATCQTNIINDGAPLIASNVTIGPSPFVLQNVRMKPETVTIAFGTVTKIETGIIDLNANYIDTGVTAGMFMLKPGQFLRMTYTGSAGLINMREIW